jgi:hypothetical protein
MKKIKIEVEIPEEYEEAFNTAVENILHRIKVDIEWVKK